MVLLLLADLAIIILLCMATLSRGVPSVPPPVSANAVALQAAINKAANRSSSGSTTATVLINLAPVVYTFSNASLLINGARNVIIDGGGAAELVFFYGHGISLTNCVNVTLRHLVIDSDPPNYAQGVVISTNNTSGGSTNNTTALAATATTTATLLQANFDPRFLSPDTSLPPFNNPGGLAGAKVTFWDPATRRVLRDVRANFMAKGSPSLRLSPGSTRSGNANSSSSSSSSNYTLPFELSLRNPFQTGALPPAGSLVTVIPRRGFTWQALNCSQMTAENVTVHAGGNMGFLERLGAGNNTYRGVKIVRRAGSPGLVALNADGFHSSDVGTGPTLIDSEISFTGDDFFNCHNRMLVVCGSSNSRRAPSLSLSLTAPTAADDTLVLIDTSGGALSDTAAIVGTNASFWGLLPGSPHRANPALGQATIVDVSEEMDANIVRRCHNATEIMAAPPHNAHFVVSVASAPIYRVRFTAALPHAVTPFSTLANLEAHSAYGAHVARNHFHDACGTGGRVSAKAPGGTYTDNIFERFGGMHVYSEQIWLEGALNIKNVQLRNNTLVDANGPPLHVDVFAGLPNISCHDTLFVVNGNKTFRPAQC